MPFTYKLASIMPANLANTPSPKIPPSQVRAGGSGGPTGSPGVSTPPPLPVAPASTPPPARAPETMTNRAADHCQATVNPDGSINVMLHITPDVGKRYINRVGARPMDEYLWQNILRAALESHVY